MSETPDIQAFETEDEFHHVRFRDPDRFDDIRTPDWAGDVAESVRSGSEVRTGHVEDGDDWEVQSVLIPREVDEDEARSDARSILEKVES